MRKGSVHQMPHRARATRDALTAIVNSIGSSGGTTEVTIMTQLRYSLNRSRPGSASPARRTYPAAARAKTRRRQMNAPASQELAVTRSPACACKIVRMSRPWAVS